MDLANILKKINECFGKMYSSTKQFNQLEKGLYSYIAENDLKNFLGVYKEEVQSIDENAIRNNTIYKGIIAQFLVRTAIAADTVSKTNGGVNREIDINEAFIIKQIVYLYQTGHMDQLFSRLKSGTAYLVNEHEVTTIIDELGRRYGSSRLSLLKGDVNNNSINALEVLICMVINLRYAKGLTAIIDNEILKQDEDLFKNRVVTTKPFVEPISINLIKRQAITFILNNKTAQQKIKILLSQHINLLTVEEISVTAVYGNGPKDNKNFSIGEIILMINEAIIGSKSINDYLVATKSTLPPENYKKGLCSFLGQIKSEEMTGGTKEK